MRILSPIALFVFNRPWHTEQTLEALSRNELADQSVLYIFCDGYKKNETTEGIEKIKSVREICRRKKWAKEVIILEKEVNKGLAASIISGVTEILEKHGKVIVLEDDLKTSAGFLRYMNDALDFYDSEEKVMHISGYWFPVKKSAERLPETFFYRAASCWGWATWKRAWQNLETDANDLKEKIAQMPQGIKRFNVENSYPHLMQLNQNIKGEINTWAIKWYASVFLHDGLCLHPNVSLVQNTGFDNSGFHSKTTSIFDWPALSSDIRINSIPLQENTTAIKLLQQFHKKVYESFFSKVKRNILSKLGIKK
jgi:hypothetical protein